jgi:DNA polymerase-1
MQNTKYHYFIDTKLLAYFLVQRGSSILDIYNKIADLLIDKPKGKVYAAFDVGKSSYRSNIYSQYKGHRAKAKEKKSEEEIKQHKEFEADYIKLIEFSKGLNIQVLAATGVEADDLISIEVEKLKDDKSNYIYLVTGDMDYVNSVVGTDNVAIINALKGGELIDNDCVKIMYGETLNNRDRFNVHKSIFGDKSDNIKFLRNFGAVKAQEVFNTLYSKHETPTVDDILDEVKVFTKKHLNIKVHENHVDDGRETIRDALEANLLLADTFRDTSKMTELQVQEFEECLKRVPPTETKEEYLINKGIELFNVPVTFYQKAQRVFNIK